MDSAAELTKYINCCLLPKLTRNYDECETPAEYIIRENNLRENFQLIIDLLKKVDLRKQSESSTVVIASLFILYQELRSDGTWNTEKCREYSDKLTSTFNNMYGVPLNCVLQSKSNAQKVFDTLMLDLHKRISSDFKKYPALIEVYYSIIQNIKAYNIVLKPIAVLPASLLLIDDYMNNNKIKGLKCCILVLQCLDQKDFIDGNYYEVIYGGLKKTVGVKDIEVTKLVQACLLELLRMLPFELKVKKMDDAFSSILEQLYTESNVYRKAACFNFIKSIVIMHGINIVNKKLFKTILYDNIQICYNDAVAKILLADVLECLEIWLKHCWCIWRLSSDHKLLSALFTLLYVCKIEKNIPQIHNLIVTVITLCKKEEQKIICNNLENPLQIQSQEFVQRLKLINKDIQ